MFKVIWGFGLFFAKNKKPTDDNVLGTDSDITTSVPATLSSVCWEVRSYDEDEDEEAAIQ